LIKELFSTICPSTKLASTAFCYCCGIFFCCLTRTCIFDVAEFHLVQDPTTTQ